MVGLVEERSQKHIVCPLRAIAKCRERAWFEKTNQTLL
jgi:hypothetical protein